MAASITLIIIAPAMASPATNNGFAKVKLVGYSIVFLPYLCVVGAGLGLPQPPWYLIWFVLWGAWGLG